MGEILFWLEAALSSVLFTAMWVALTAKIRWRLLGGLVRWLALTVLLIEWIAVITLLSLAQAMLGGVVFVLACSAVAGGVYLAGKTVVIERARRGAARQWRASRLALAFAAALLATGVTYWNLSLAADHYLGRIGAEAGVMALDAAPAKVPDALNAALVYQRVARMMDDVGLEEGDDWSWGDSESDPRQQPEMLAYLQANRRVIELLRQAADLPGCYFDYSRPDRITTAIDYLGPCRKQARLAGMSACVNVRRGDLDDAVADLRAGFALAEHCNQQHSLLSSLVAIAIDRMLCESLGYALEQGDFSDSQLAAMSPSPAVGFYSSYPDICKTELSCLLSMLTMTDEQWSEYLIDVVRAARPDTKPDSYPGPGYFTRLPSNAYRVFLVRQDIRSSKRYFRRFIELAERPYHESRSEMRDLATQESKGYGGLFTRLLTPSISRANDLIVEADACHRLAILAVAMERYRLAHGAYPADLDALDLEPGYDTRVDPFTGEPMKMSVNAEGRTVLYSVGEDLDDDGGRAVDYGDRGQPRDGDIIIALPR